ncbi:MAG TPA: MJ1255/VC2487 family glycosyltransferase [Anaeromyxobacteraceae bacterium]|nr:MJ1255/VC2487 family glycosyltransferase [Anaeromyxobacteraceae bacterium]
MRILYGVVGEGMGHALRSRVVLDELTREHQVQVVVSGRAHDYLKARESDRLGVTRIWGLTMVYEDNEVRNFRTVLENVRGAVTGGLPKNVKAYFEVATRFDPEVVVSDFETWSYLFAKSRGLPVISIDNQQIINRCTHRPEILAGHEADFRLARAVVKAKLPGCFHYLVTTFFYPSVSKPRTSLHPPVLRSEILAARPEPGDHLLVYQTSASYARLLEVLRRSGVECRVYGVRRGIREEQVEGNLRFRPFSEAGFVEDLRRARGVLSNGGFTLMGEAVSLHKPMLSVPVKKQFEQVLNARYLDSLGYGMAADEVTPAVLGRFLERLPELSRSVAAYRQDGNRELLGTLAERLAAARGQPPSAGEE